MRKQLDVEAGLRNKGFTQENSHHRYFIYHTLDGRKSRIRTRTSHGDKDIDKSLLRLMARQCRLTYQEFLRLVDCPLSRTDYEARIAEHL